MDVVKSSFALEVELFFHVNIVNILLMYATDKERPR